MNWLPIVINFLLAIHVIVSLLIVLLVLMQRPKNEGLGAAFGGGMTENLFGAQTTNVLQTATRYLGGLFFALTLLLSWLYVKKGVSGGSALQQRLSAPTTIPATPAPVATPAPDGKFELAPTATPAPGGSFQLAPPPATPAPDAKLLPAPAVGDGPSAASPAVKPVPAGEAGKTAPEAPAPVPVPNATAPTPAPPVTPEAAKPAPAPAEKAN